jgi:hypothetical protein
MTSTAVRQRELAVREAGVEFAAGHGREFLRPLRHEAQLDNDSRLALEAEARSAKQLAAAFEGSSGQHADPRPGRDLRRER